MVAVGIFYGSTGGNTKDVAEQIQRLLGPACQGIFSLNDVDASHMQHFDRIFLGCPTYNTGELQQDWERALPALEKLSWAGKRVALFAYGDMVGYPSTFMDAMGIIHDSLVAKGAQAIGQWRTDGYTFHESKAVKNGLFCGLPLDDSQHDQTAARVQAWVDYVRPYMTA